MVVVGGRERVRVREGGVEGISSRAAENQTACCRLSERQREREAERIGREFQTVFASNRKQ